MFERLISSIRKKRHSDKLGWKFLFFVKDILFKCNHKFKIFIESCYNLWWIYHNFKNNSVFRKLIEGQRILIIGSGPSVAELGRIPEDVKIFTCKAGLKLFVDKKLNREIDLYIFYRMMEKKSIIIGKETLKKEKKQIAVQKNKFTEELIQKTKIKVFVTQDLHYIRRKKQLKGSYSRLIFDPGRNNYYLERLIKPYGVKQIKGNSLHRCTSSGMRLLQYALYFKAKEIYLIGLDFGEKGYFWGESNYNISTHADIDENFIKIVSKKHNNIYSLSRNNPIARYIPYKKL